MDDTQPKQKPEFDADRYLRIALKSHNQIESVAQNISLIADALNAMPKVPVRYKPGGATQTQGWMSENDQAMLVKMVQNTSQGLYVLNSQVPSIYAHRDNAYDIKEIENPEKLLKSAEAILDMAITDPEISNTNIVSDNRRKMHADLTTIRKRLLPAFSSGKNGKGQGFVEKVTDYKNTMDDRLTSARSGMLPEGLGHETRTIIPPITEEYKAAQKVERPHKIPKTERTRRPLERGGNGELLSTDAAYKQIKEDKASELTGQSFEAEKTRVGNGPAWVRREAQKQAKAETEEHER